MQKARAGRELRCRGCVHGEKYNSRLHVYREKYSAEGVCRERSTVHLCTCTERSTVQRAVQGEKYSSPLYVYREKYSAEVACSERCIIHGFTSTGRSTLQRLCSVREVQFTAARVPSEVQCRGCVQGEKCNQGGRTQRDFSLAWLEAV